MRKLRLGRGGYYCLCHVYSVPSTDRRQVFLNPPNSLSKDKTVSCKVRKMRIRKVSNCPKVTQLVDTKLVKQSSTCLCQKTSMLKDHMIWWRGAGCSDFLLVYLKPWLLYLAGQQKLFRMLKNFCIMSTTSMIPVDLRLRLRLCILKTAASEWFWCFRTHKLECVASLLNQVS